MAITAIALGIVMMLVAIATGGGLQRKIREKIAAFNGHIQIYNYDANASDVSVKPISLHQDFYPSFEEIPEITHIQGVAAKGGIIRTENTYESVIAKGVGTDYDWSQMTQFLVEGSIPDYTKNDISNDILISQYLANRLQLKLGENANALFLKDENSQIPNQRNFKIVGIYNSGFQDYDATYIITDLRQIQHMNRWQSDQIGNFELFVNDFNKIEDIGNQVYGQTLSSLDSQTILQKFPFIFEWLGMFDFNIYLIIGIMIIVGGFNMITAILVLILEKTPMIGILKSLGSYNRSIRRIFLYNAAYIISLGLLWGNAIGLTLLYLQYRFSLIKLDPNTYYVTEVPIYIHPLSVIALNAGVMLLCLLMLLLPTYIISRISPIQSIKTV
ncbi:MAG: ABC transporter permease [Capnocytophaga sp.]|nr:ABC transporter permease [Capnocytophaga sp.]